MCPSETKSEEFDFGIVEPVRRSVRVLASAARAFTVITEEMDAWWPTTHHIGDSPLKCVIVERKTQGAVYGRQEDDSEYRWGTVLA